MERKALVVRTLTIASGIGLAGFAAATSNAALERALLGQATGSLRWGPTLFRALLVAHGMLLVALGLAYKTRAGCPLGLAAARQPERPTAEHRQWLVLVGISGVALALRLWALDSCLWFDEVLTLVDFVRRPFGQVVTSFPSQNQHMLFSVLAHWSIGVFGENAWALRLPSVAFGVASVWALFLLGRSVLGVREALLACALMTASYHHVWFSQNARGYTGLLFFSTLSTWLWIEGRSRRAWSRHISYAVTVALGMWTHLTMVFVPAVHALLHGVDVARRLRKDAAPGAARQVVADSVRPVAAWLLAGSLTLQLYALSLPEFLRTGLHEVSLESEWTNPLWVVAESLRSLQVGFGALAVVLGGLFVAVVGWLSLARRDWMAACTLVLPPVLGGSLMLVLGHNLWPRFFFFSMGFALLIAVHGTMTAPRLALAVLSRTPGGARVATTAGLTLTGLMIAASALSLPRVYALPKQDFTGARDFVESVRHADDGVVAVGLAGLAYRRYFAPQWLLADTPEQLEDIRRSHSSVWLVYTIPVELKAYRPEIWRVVDRDFETVKVFPGTLGGGEVHVCREKQRAISNTVITASNGQ